MTAAETNTVSTATDLADHPHRALRRRVADLIVDVLLEQDVDTFFGVPGGAISPVYDALGDGDRGRIICARHETTAAFMAAGWARVTGRVPALLMTSGPGITNAVTGIASAFADGVPMVALGGEVPRSNFGRGALQEGSRYQLDTLGMVRSITKLSLEATTSQGTISQLRRLVATASSGRQGPVYMSLPLDVATADAQITRTSSQVATEFKLDPEMIKDSALALDKAATGLILVGSGARGAKDAIISLAQKLNMPVATTPKAKGAFPEDHPLSLGVYGYGGSADAKALLGRGIDVLLAIGTSLGETSTNNWSDLLKPKQTFIQIDIDGAQIGKNFAVDIGLVGPARAIIEALDRCIKHRPRALPTTPNRGPSIVPPPNDGQLLKTPEVLEVMQQKAPANTVYTSDIGEHLLFALHHLKIGYEAEFIAGIGLGSMGSGIGAAIGAKMGAPERGALSICGDYGFQMFGMAELATCVQEKTGVVFLVLNDASMRMVEAGFGSVYGRCPQIQGPRVDFAAISRACGGDGYNVSTMEELQNLPEDIFMRDKPVVIDVSIDPNQKFGANMRNVTLSNFKSSLPPGALEAKKS